MESRMSDPGPNRVVVEKNQTRISNVNGTVPATVVSKDVTLDLSDGCIIYRKRASGRKEVKFIALKSVDSCCIQFRKRNSILAAALALFLVATAMVWWKTHPPHGIGVLPLYPAILPTAPQQRMTRLALELTIGGVFLLMAFLASRRMELVISTSGSGHLFRIPVSVNVKSSLQTFVAHATAEIRKIQSWSRISASQ